MAYSCAYWDPQTMDLAAAQRAKLELIMSKLALEPGQALLDMGCGWGSLTLHAARARAQVTGVTLSREQGRYVRQRARGLGLGDRAEVRIQDYRDPLDGLYDAIASVEMGEHVGAARYPAFCAALYGRLRPGGRLLIQQMSRTTRRGGGPFIESYIAPDMDMRPVGETIRLIQDAGFEVLGVEAMREHYARTIRAWLENFEANLPAITTILTAEQVRVWRLYLAGGALAFEQGRMGVDQILSRKGPSGDRARRSSPPRRALLILQGVTFVVALKAGKHSVVDTAWGIGHRPGRPGRVPRLDSATATRRAAACCWPPRSCGACGWPRTSAAQPRQPEDPRYADMLRGHTNLYALRMVYLLQAAILWLATVPVQLGMLERSPAAARRHRRASCSLVGFAFESVGDWQLARFKADRRGRARSWTAGCGATPGTRTTSATSACGGDCSPSAPARRELPGPGRPAADDLHPDPRHRRRMTDRRMTASRPRYADYVARTSGFIPLPPKRAPKRSAAAAAPGERA